MEALSEAEARYLERVGGVSWSSDGHGGSLTAAHADLRQRLVLDRLRMATVAIYRSAR